MSEGIVTRFEFPHGLTCGDCHRIIENGEHYADRPAGAVEEVEARIPRYVDFPASEKKMDTTDIPVTLIVCVACSEKK